MLLNSPWWMRSFIRLFIHNRLINQIIYCENGTRAIYQGVAWFHNPSILLAVKTFLVPIKDIPNEAFPLIGRNVSSKKPLYFLKSSLSSPHVTSSASIIPAFISPEESFHLKKSLKTARFKDNRSMPCFHNLRILCFLKCRLRHLCFF